MSKRKRTIHRKTPLLEYKGACSICTHPTHTMYRRVGASKGKRFIWLCTQCADRIKRNADLQDLLHVTLEGMRCKIGSVVFYHDYAPPVKVEAQQETLL